MKVVLFGASGAIGQLLLEKLLKNGHELYVYTRSPQKIAQKHENLRIIKGELKNLDQHKEIFHDADAVISVMGPPMVRKYEGTELLDAHQFIIQEVKKQASKRFITLATPSVAFEKDKKSFMTGFPPFFAKLAFPKAYTEIKAIGEEIRKSDINWTVVRIIAPVDKETKPYKTSFGDTKISFSLSREQIAEFIKDCAEQKTFVRSMPIIGS